MPIMLAANAPQSASTEPTLKSIPAVKITKRHTHSDDCVNRGLAQNVQDVVDSKEVRV